MNIKIGMRLLLLVFVQLVLVFSIGAVGLSTSNEAIRLNKVFKATHSRRQADDLISSGRVTINGKPVDSAGCRVVPFRDIVRLDGRIVNGWEALNSCAAVGSNDATTTRTPTTTTTEKTTTTARVHEYVKYWKPCGVTCTTDQKIPSNIIDRMKQDGYHPPNRVYPVGRLDKDTSGLILVTSDGRLPNSALKGRYKQPKTYEVLVDRFISNEQIQRLRDGVVITTVAQRDRKRAPPLTAKTKPCLVERIHRRKLRMTLVEGRNRQIRKMIASLGLSVVELFRCKFMNIQLHPLRGPGDWAPLDKKELRMVTQVISFAKKNEGED